MVKPKIFIGSSVEGLSIAYAVQQNLVHDAEVTVWDQGVFELSATTIESLVETLSKCDFGIFVFSPDDITKIRKKEFLTVRDNVIFELGMFIGRLGRNRSFIIMPDKPGFHFPTDLLGIAAGKYDTSRTDGSYQAATGPVCHQLRVQIKKQGVLQNLTSETTTEKEAFESVGSEKHDNWWNHYLDKDYEKALALIDKEGELESDSTKKKELMFWKIYIEYKIDADMGMEHIQEQLISESEDLDTYIYLSRILLWEDEMVLSLQVIDSGLVKFSDNDILISRKSEYFEKLGKMEEAITLIKSKMGLGDEILAIRLAECYERLEDKKLGEAFLLIKEAYNISPSSEALIFKLARLSQELGKEKIALYLLDKLVKRFPSTDEYWGYLGNACVALGLNNKALVAYRKANELANNQQSWIISNIGNLLKNQGFFSDAREYFNKSLAIDPNSEYAFSRSASAIKSEEEEREKYTKILKEGVALLS